MACAHLRFILFIAILAGFLGFIHASPDHNSGSDSRPSEDNSNLAFLGTVTIATSFCFVLLIFGCACCCRRGFAKFEETTTQETVVGQSYTNFNDFSPPTESTPSYPPGLEPDTVTIEPLPDLAARAGTSPASIGQSSWLQAGGGMPEQLVQQGDLKHINNPRFQFPRSQLSYVEEIGTGWFGKVLQGEAHRMHAGLRKTRVVIKQLRDTATAEEQVLFLQEVQPFREVNHPNVLQLQGQCIESMPFLLIVEYAPFGDLKGYLCKHQEQVQDMAHRDVQLRMACDMVSGLMWLHQADFIHIDLAARNCMVSADTSVKIGDYGLSLEKYPDDYYITKDQSHAVPIRWLGPEVIEITEKDMTPKKVTKESNVWSFGVIMLELSTGGKKPYSNLTNEEVLKQVVMEQEIRLDKPSLDVRYASRWFEIMMFCWLEAEMRPTMKEIHELLMHLRSNRDRIEMDDFQNRWDALKPSAMQDSSESSKEEGQFPETKEEGFETAPMESGVFTSGIANGFVAPQGQIGINGNPNMNMNAANVDVEPSVDAGGDFQTTPLGDVLRSDAKPSTDSEVPAVSNELDFVIQPTVAQDTETAPPVSNLNEAGDPGFDLFLQPTGQGTSGDDVTASSPIPAPASTNIPEVLISSPTSEPAMDEENQMFEEEITPVVSNEVQAAAPSATDPFGMEGTEPTPSNAIDESGVKQISNPIFQLDSEATTPTSTTPDMSMTTPPAEKSTDFDAPRTSTPSSRTSDLLAEVGGSDDDSSLSFMSATSTQLKKDHDDDDGDTSSFNTMVTSQSDDPSFFSFSSPGSSRNNSLQTSTDGSFKTITDSTASDDLDEQTYVDQTEESSGLEDGISDVDVGPPTPQPGFISLSGNVILHHDLPPDTKTSQNLTSLYGTKLETSDFSQSQTEMMGAQQQKTVQIQQQSKKGGFSIKVASKKVTQTSVKHVRQVRQVTRDADLLQMYKKDDDVAIVQEVKGSSNLPSGDLFSQSGQALTSSILSQESSSNVTQTGDLEESTLQTQHKSMQKTETRRTVTVVRNVSSSSAQQERVIDLMSGTVGDSQPSHSQDERIMDWMSSRTAEGDSSMSPAVLQPSVLQPTMVGASGEAPLIPDLMGGGVPLNVEQTMSLSSDGNGMTMKQSMAMQGGGNFSKEREGQSTQVQWSTSASVQQEHTLASSTGLGLPEFNLTLNSPEGQQPKETASKTDTRPGWVEF